MTTGSDVAKVEEGANRRIWTAAEDTMVHGGGASAGCTMELRSVVGVHCVVVVAKLGAS
ncbi:uncharacterized protein M6B38_302225 [Iris pallida]|uniref:Uncharacterized protein n=1 Tax=Iris pallida TaxID=29817 RepID=A0AAX6HN39_IRIPA|nr:uncharacterized protein M6B38_302225 [Iris pallida]